MFRKKAVRETYNREEQRPVIKSSICTGEKVAGFKDIRTGKFTEVTAIRSDKDMDEFLKKYGISVTEVKTEW